MLTTTETTFTALGRLKDNLTTFLQMFQTFMFFFVFRSRDVLTYDKNNSI
jgi:hypothetical protein